MESCSFCNGKIKPKNVDIIKKVNGKIIVIDEVPADVCNQCGEKYYSLEVVENIEKILDKIKKDKIKTNIIYGEELKYEPISV